MGQKLGKARLVAEAEPFSNRDYPSLAVLLMLISLLFPPSRSLAQGDHTPVAGL